MFTLAKIFSTFFGWIQSLMDPDKVKKVFANQQEAARKGWKAGSNDTQEEEELPGFGRTVN